jgi:hypothetical protein
MMVYEKGEDVKNPFNFVAKLPAPQGLTIFEDINFKRPGQFTPKLLNQTMRCKIHSMTMNSQENTLVFTTENN